MCGIVGIVNNGAGIDPLTLSKMSEAIKHRGPDDAGQFIYDETNISVGFASRRLSILDLSEAGHMPMSNSSKSIWLTYNGEIYNHATLHDQLVEKGYTYSSRTDTETLIYSFEEMGADCFKSLNGMFAAAILDKRDSSVTLVRDRMGIKPLYYYWDGSQLIFSSELKSLICHPAVPNSIDKDTLSIYLALGYIPSPFTIFTNVRKLQPGHYLVFREGKISINKYWEPRYQEPESDERTDQELIAQTRKAVECAIQQQLMSDVPLGVLLSGGIDSTIIAAVAQKYSDRPIDTFSIGFKTQNSSLDPFYNDDMSFAGRVSKQLGTRHHEVIINDDADLLDQLKTLVYNLDEPVWEQSFLSIFRLSQLARSNGIKVLLTGDGSDELFGGYPWYLGAQRLARYEQIPFLQLVLPLFATIYPEGATKQKFDDLRKKYRQRDYIKYRTNYSDFDEKLLGQIITKNLTPGFLEDFITPILNRPGNSTLADKFAMADLVLWVAEHFNQRIDRMTMLNSVEARVPFQDNLVVDLALTIPMKRKIKNGVQKYLLREAFKDLIPDFVLERPKRPFATPGKAWLQGALKPAALNYLGKDFLNQYGLLNGQRIEGLTHPYLQSKSIGTRDPNKLLWSFLILSIWLEQWKIKVTD